MNHKIEVEKFHTDSSKKGIKKWVAETEPPVSFFVQISDNILDPENHDLLEIGRQGKDSRRLIIVDKNVYGLYGEKIENYFKTSGINYKIFPVESSEEKKDLETLLLILGAMEEFKLERSGEPVLAVGGGVLLDVVGIAATLYRRGVPYIRIPTTLLALVDASVGVKTGINHFGRRNRLGSYYGPIGAYLDRSFLRTLARKEISNGCGEILKMAVVKDSRLFELLEKHGARMIDDKFQNGQEPTEVIERSIQGMVEELAPNLWEKDMKRLVNFGHSFSAVVEMRALPELSHGEAVALDVLYSCILSANRGLMKSNDMERVGKTMKLLELPTFHPLFGDIGTLEEALADTVRHRDGAQELPIPLSIGRAIFLNDFTTVELKKASDIMKEKFST